jgi:ribosomal protein L11 methyltransferase
LVEAFGGAVDKLSSGWQTRYFSAARSKPIKVGWRLIVASDPADLPAGSPSGRTLIIPASAAFGTGEHATTAMSLRMLERATRPLASGWRMLDAGTGSGILAFAGRRFGAGEVIAIDNDPLAISVARQNARANKMRGVTLLVGDVNRGPSGTFQIIAANLYSELLVSQLPKWRKQLDEVGKLILSGVLRRQEREVADALTANHFTIGEVRRRGKWIALLAAPRQKRS